MSNSESARSGVVSVITVVFNDRAGLEKTCASINSQTYDNIQHVVIDGGSTDGTVELIQKNNDLIDFWLSEPDDGIYHAMNKGIVAANGEWVIFLNAGDYFYNSETLENMLASCGGESMIYGAASINGKRTLVPKGFTRINLLLWGTRVACHQAILLKREVLCEYSLNYRYKGELDWYINIASLKGFKYRMLDYPVVVYATGGAGEKNYIYNLKEELQVIWQHFGLLTLFRMPIFLYKILRFYSRSW